MFRNVGNVRSVTMRSERKRASRRRTGMRHRPHSLVGPGKAGPLFPPPKRMERREAPGACEAPWAALAIGQPARRIRGRGCESRPGRAHLLAIGGAAPPGAPLGRARRPAAGAGCLPARRSAAGPFRPRDREGPMADYGYIFLYRRIVNASCAAGPSRGAVGARPCTRPAAPGSMLVSKPCDAPRVQAIPARASARPAPTRREADFQGRRCAARLEKGTFQRTRKTC